MTPRMECSCIEACDTWLLHFALHFDAVHATEVLAIS